MQQVSEIRFQAVSSDVDQREEKSRVVKRRTEEEVSFFYLFSSSFQVPFRHFVSEEFNALAPKISVTNFVGSAGHNVEIELNEQSFKGNVHWRG